MILVSDRTGRTRLPLPCFRKNTQPFNEKKSQLSLLVLFRQLLSITIGMVTFSFNRKSDKQSHNTQQFTKQNNGCAIESSKYVYALPVDGTDW